MARQFGILDVDGMMENMPASQFFKWIEYFGIDHFDYLQDNFRSGLIASFILNTNRSNNSDKVWQPNDFFEDSNNEEKKVEQQSDEEKFGIAKMIANAYQRGG